MQRSHFALDRNELLNIGHKRIAVIKVKKLQNQPNKNKVRLLDLSHSLFQKQKPKAERFFNLSVHNTFREVSLYLNMSPSFS